MRTVLVTGGGGYVGGVLVPALLSAGYRVRVLDLFLFRRPLEEREGLEIIVGDIRDRDAVAGAVAGADSVIHLAAMSNDPSGDLQPEITREINLDASLALGAEAERQGVRRFVNLSSASVYGVSEEERVVETLPLNPQTLYAKYKAEVETELLSRHSDDFEVTSVRPATLSGYAPRLRLDLTVHIFTYQALLDGRLRVFGGAQQRPNLSVHDLVRALMMLLELPASTVGGRTFNLVESNHSVREIAERVAHTLDRPDLPLETVPTNDNRSYRLNGDLARAVLGFVPEYGIDHSIAAVAAALRDGRVPEPGGTAWRNVAHLTNHPLTSWDAS